MRLTVRTLLMMSIRLPVYQTYTAERATYQNLVREVPLEAVGEFHNPYREYIGALIRADIFGYVFPGSPRRAALLSYRDAALSHRANGIDQDVRVHHNMAA